MVFRRRASKRKPRAPRRKIRVPRRKANKLFATKQMASIQETVQFSDLTPNLDTSYVFNLSQFPRARELAPNFKWYKAAKVVWTIEPLFNVFTDDGTPQTVPYIYTAMNRTQDSTGMNLADYQAMGVKPQKLTSKKVISYRPNWCSPGLISAFTDDNSFVRQIRQNGLKPQYGYLQCPNNNTGYGQSPDLVVPIDNITALPSTASPIDTNTVIFNGHQTFAQQLLASAGLPCARVVATVHWVFKDPHFTRAPNSSMTAVPAVSAVSIDV